MCVLHAKLAAKDETPPTTSAAKGSHPDQAPKRRNDRRDDRFKTQINNRPHGFALGHIHQAPVGLAGPIVVPLFVPPAPPTSLRHIKQSGVATPNAGTTGADSAKTRAPTTSTTTPPVFPLGAIRGHCTRSLGAWLGVAVIRGAKRGMATPAQLRADWLTPAGLRE